MTKKEYTVPVELRLYVGLKLVVTDFDLETEEYRVVQVMESPYSQFDIADIEQHLGNNQGANQEVIREIKKEIRRWKKEDGVLT